MSSEKIVDSKNCNIKISARSLKELKIIKLEKNLKTFDDTIHNMYLVLKVRRWVRTEVSTE